MIYTFPLHNRLGYVPLLSPSTDLSVVAPAIAKLFQGQFCVARSFDPEFLARLMYHGFLTMTTKDNIVIDYLVTPKLHTERCVLKFESMLSLLYCLLFFPLGR